MVNERKVFSRDTPKYTSSSDESSDDDEDYCNYLRDLIDPKLIKLMN
jgi:hypothetical protein